MINLAITSPSTSASPETFIQSHIDGIKANTTYYYGDLIPRYIAGLGLFSMDNRHIGDIKSWINLLKSINPFEYHNSKLNIKNYLFAKSLKHNNIDVVLAEYGTTGAEILKACEYAGVPLVVHFHGRDCTAYENIKKYKGIWGEMFAYAYKIIAVSHDMEDRLQNLGCSKDKIIYIPCCPDSKFTLINPSLEKRQFIFVGRFTDKKAPYATILAFEPVAHKFPDAKLIMAGDGPLLNTCHNLVKILNLQKQVLFVGKINPDETVKLMSESRAFVQHSITAEDGDMEGTPVSVMEASAMGLPVISTRHAGIPDVIIDGETGLLNNELDVTGMSKNMMKILENKDLAMFLGRKGRIRMKEHFTKKWQMNTMTQVLVDAVHVKQIKDK